MSRLSCGQGFRLPRCVKEMVMVESTRMVKVKRAAL